MLPPFSCFQDSEMVANTLQYISCIGIDLIKDLLASDVSWNSFMMHQKIKVILWNYFDVSL